MLFKLRGLPVEVMLTNPLLFFLFNFNFFLFLSLIPSTSANRGNSDLTCSTYELSQPFDDLTTARSHM